MNLAERTKRIVLTPATEWRVIAREHDSPAILLQTYVACLAGIPAVADFIGMTVIGVSLPNSAVARVDFLSGFLAALFSYGTSFVITSLQAAVIYALAPTFGARRDVPSAFKLAAYSYTPAWLAGIFLIVPGLHFLTVLGLYGLFVLFKGMPLLILAPPEKALPFAAIVTACGVAAGLAVGAVRAALFSLPGIL
jgi:hypothetical protein